MTVTKSIPRKGPVRQSPYTDAQLPLAPLEVVESLYVFGVVDHSRSDWYLAMQLRERLGLS